MTFEEFDRIIIDFYEDLFSLQYGDIYYEYGIEEEYDLFTSVVGSGSIPVYEVTDDGDAELQERY